MNRSANQAWRVVFLIAYFIILFVVNRLLFQEWIPAGLWFWAAFLAILLSDLIAQPYFTAPKDAVSNAIAAISTIVPLLTESVLDDSNRLWWIAALIVSIIILASAVIAMVFGDSTSPRMRVAAQILTYVTGMIGTPKVLFTVIFYLSIAAFHSQASEVRLLSLVWIIVVLGRPLEGLRKLIMRIRELWGNARRDTQLIGLVAQRREPGLVTINLTGDTFPDVGELVLFPLSNTHGQLGVVLDNYRLSDARWSRVLVFADRVPRDDIESGWGAENSALACGKGDVKENWLDNELFQDLERVLGCVIENSTVGRVRIELYKDSLQLFEGQLLNIKVNNRVVLYQVVNGVTESELLQGSSKHGFMTIEARKLGLWNRDLGSFEQVPWVPQIYSPVFMVAQTETQPFHRDYIGYVPRSNYGIEVKTHDLVTHNTAILGVLGSGKTSLALELIYRMVEDGIKVWIIDITGQYEPAMHVLIHTQKQLEADAKIQDSISSTANTLNSNKELGGNHRVFAQSIRKHIHDFLSDDTWRVRVFNPTKYVVTEQTSGVFNSSAGFGQLTVTQITRIVAEEMLESVNGEMAEKAKLCLVLEEAHVLVPEWGSVTQEGDKNATNGTARAIMQGRKYGFGCLLITQRTANVTKSILNQCNTIFGLRVFDATGMEFLKNYIGPDYAALLNTLPFRHCVALGRGLNTKDPLIVELNDRDAFRCGFTIGDEDYFEKRNSIEATSGETFVDNDPDLLGPPDEDIPF